MQYQNVIRIIVGAGVIYCGMFLIFGYFKPERSEPLSSGELGERHINVSETPEVLDVSAPAANDVVVSIEPATPMEEVGSKQWSGVFFTSQAPTGEWHKSEFQNGCEEASALMAQAFLTGKTYTKEETKRELVALARYQEKKIGQGVDTDVADTAETLLKGYFDITDFQTIYDFTLDDLKRSSNRGLIIVPTNGRALKNPNFTQPGPLQHMLVITGYDAVKQEFITNDPGTRKGAGYRYPEVILFAAIREYPTGQHLPITAQRKAMIVVPPPTNP